MVGVRGGVAAFVWRCPECRGVYDLESLQFLYSDGPRRYCPCGGLLDEDVEPVGYGEGHRYRLVIPAHLEGTRLHEELLQRERDDDAVDVCVGGAGGYVSIFCDD